MGKARLRMAAGAALATATCLGTLLGAAHAAPIQALSTKGSIVYTSGGNVWIARPNGSHKHMVTHDGKAATPYQFPTQAANGSIEAVHLNALVHMDRNGKVLSPRPVVATGPSNNFSLHTLVMGAAISPNAQTVAVSILEYQGVLDTTTGTKSTNIIAQNMEYWKVATGKKISTRSLAGTYLESPSWINNKHLLMFAPYNTAAPEVYIDGPALDGWNWFADGDPLDPNRESLDQGDLTASRDKLALIRGVNLLQEWRNAEIQIYSVSGLHATPKAVCAIHAQHGALAKPTWSPDGTTLAWSDSNGIWETPVQLASPNCGVSPRLVFKGGTTPDWGTVGISR